MSSVGKELAAVFLTMLFTDVSRAEQDNVRDVTPPGFTRAFRVDPDFGTAPKKTKVFQRIRILSEGALKGETNTIVLTALSIPARRHLCSTSSGSKWPCGSMAYVALHNLVHDRDVVCEVSEHGQPLGVCRVEGTDIAEWMLQNGWADLASTNEDSKYKRALTFAKERRVGIWSVELPPIGSR